ncbi:hypothetical protein B0H11DRAFT_1907806 [Mycena galericulata]|nr:hypothetical protein B0H11DRAFT_1907806 [Mycena galericulata]
MPDLKTTEHYSCSPMPPPSCDAHSAVPQITRVVIRFDLTPTHSPTRADPLNLYSAIEDALSPPETFFGGVRWTQRGNLVLKPAQHLTPDSLLLQKAKIWKAIRPFLGLPATYSCPPFELDKPWHSVVFHGVPTPPDRKPDTFTLDSVGAPAMSRALSRPFRCSVVRKISGPRLPWLSGYPCPPRPMLGDLSKTVAAFTVLNAESHTTAGSPWPRALDILRDFAAEDVLRARKDKLLGLERRGNTRGVPVDKG